MRRQFELPNDLAAALADNSDAMLLALEQRLGLRVYLRGNLLTLDGDEARSQSGVRVLDELGALASPPDEATLASVIGVDRRRATRPPRCSTTSSGATARPASCPGPSARSATSTRSATNTITFGIGPAGHRQDVPRGRARGRSAERARRSTGSSSRAPRSKPASGSASSPAT